MVEAFLSVCITKCVCATQNSGLYSLHFAIVFTHSCNFMQKTPENIATISQFKKKKININNPQKGLQNPMETKKNAP